MSSNKPFPSSDLDVFKDNSVILDNFVNSQDNEYPDRFNRKRPTITGIIKEAFSVRTDISNMNETLIGQSRWDVVPKNTSLTLGGDNGALNKQAQALFNRTEMLKIHSREALRRTYLEVGLNLVSGSFETGGTLNTLTDILLEEKTGKCYSWTGSFPKVVGKGTLPSSEVEFVDKTNSSVIESIQESLDQLEEKISESRTPVLSIEFIQKRSAMWPGYVPADGGTFSRTMYPSAFKAVQDGLVPVCTETEWLTDPSKRGCFTLGDGVTTFRVPDYNGVLPDSIGAPVFRGDGKNTAPNGNVQGDAIREIEGEFRTTYSGPVTGAHYVKRQLGRSIGWSGSDNYYGEMGFKASLAVPTAPENRMVNISGCWGIKLFGAVINESNVDATYLAAEVANLTAKVNSIIAQLGVKREVCLVNALGTGIDNEIVEPLITPTITNGARIVLPNPFGNDTPVECEVQIKVGVDWGDPCFIYSTGGTPGGYGVKASYFQGKGIIVQAGGNALSGSSRDTGNPFNMVGTVTSAPYRVIVRKTL